jgi:cysteinyl-tRNA synthetase
MPTQLYNTLTHSLQPFTPLTPGPDSANPLSGSTIRLYTCGPTVYDYAHIGNFRAFLFADLLRRYLEFKGSHVHQVMNMTDVGHMVDDSHADAQGVDKMAIAQQKMKASKKSGQALVDNPDDPYQVAQFFVDRFLEDARALQVEVVRDYDQAPSAAPLSPITNYQLPVTKDAIMPRPTRLIPAFIKMIETLLTNGHAYLGSDGVVYYSVASFPAYGRLSGNTIAHLEHGAGGRTAHNAAKRHPADFFLWKPDPRHLMRWPSPWGEGYPGWHIECSCMATILLGPSIDIHTGGEDNIFPHHECEIAQSEAATGQPFSQFWLHTRHLMVDGTKMSKSKGNFYTIRDLVAKGYDPLAIRYALISTRYRESMNFSLQSLHEAASAVTTLRDLADKLQTTVASIDEAAGENDRNAGVSPAGGADALVGGTSLPLQRSDQKLLDAISAVMDDDLNIAGALAALFTWAAPLTKQKQIPFPQARSALATLQQIDHVLGIIFPPLRSLPQETRAQIEALLEKRTAARAAKDWPLSDALRKDLLALGVEIKDTPTATIWRPRLAPATP